MPYGNVVKTGTQKLKGVWWIEDEEGPADAAYPDEWDQMEADAKIFEIGKNLPETAPVMRSDDGDPVPRDWLDVLLYEARPSQHITVEWVEGPFHTDAESAEDLLAWVIKHGTPTDMEIGRIFIP